MNRGAAYSILILGTAWTLAGAGAIATAVDSKGRRRVELETEIAFAEKLGEDEVRETKEELDRVSQQHEELVAKAKDKLAKEQAKVDEVSQRFDDMIEEEQDKGRSESAIAKIERQKETALRRFVAARDAAQEWAQAAEDSQKAAVAEVRERIKKADADKAARIEEAKKRLEEPEAPVNLWKPAIALLLGVSLLGMGVLGLPRRTMAGPAARPVVAVAASRRAAGPKPPRETTRDTGVPRGTEDEEEGEDRTLDATPGMVAAASPLAAPPPAPEQTQDAPPPMAALIEVTADDGIRTTSTATDPV